MGKWKKYAKQRDRRNAELATELAEVKAERSLLLRLLTEKSDAESIIRAMGEAFNPQPQQQMDVDSFFAQIEKMAAEDETVKPANNFPDIEFDDFMDPSMSRKVEGEWTATEVTAATAKAATANGLPDPTTAQDGTPRFQSGSSGPPPVGGME